VTGGSAHGPLKNDELMTQSQVLERDSRRPEEHGAEERPDPDYEEHGATPASGLRARAETLPHQQRREQVSRQDKQMGFLTGTTTHHRRVRASAQWG